MSAETQQAGYLLHYTPWRDTSFIVDLFTLEHGRVGLVARGARSARPATRALYQPFRPLLVSWVGDGDLLTLTGIEESGAPIVLDGAALGCGYYLNELVLRLLGKGQPQPALFGHYALALAALEEAGRGGRAGLPRRNPGSGTDGGGGLPRGEVRGERAVPAGAGAATGADGRSAGEGEGAALERTLRVFELQLLEALGLLPDLARCTADGRPLEPERRYRFHAAAALAVPLDDAAEASPVYGIPKRPPARGGSAAGSAHEIGEGYPEGAGLGDGVEVRGRTLLDLAALELGDARTREEAKGLMRRLIAGQLGGRPLRSRSLFEALAPPPAAASGSDAGDRDGKRDGRAIGEVDEGDVEDDAADGAIGGAIGGAIDARSDAHAGAEPIGGNGATERVGDDVGGSTEANEVADGDGVSRASGRREEGAGRAGGEDGDSADQGGSDARGEPYS